MKSITLAQEVYYKTTNWSPLRGWGPWRNFPFPPAPALPPRPWHPDDDALYAGGPLVRVENSSAIIEHMKANGTLLIHTGSVVPTSSGKTDGRRINLASADDPLYRITTNLLNIQPGDICVHDGKYPKLDDGIEGRLIRIARDTIRQGYPMRNYSDTKVHIFDPIDNIIIEIQHCEDLGNRRYRAHGLSLVDLSLPSVTESHGRSAAKMSLTEGTLRFDDAMRGWTQLTTMGTTQAFALDFLAPARGTDGKSTHPNAVWMGMILRLKPEVARQLKDMGRPQLTAVVKSYENQGIMVVDTSGNHATGIEPDARWDQNQLAALRALTLDAFDIWRRV